MEPDWIPSLAQSPSIRDLERLATEHKGNVYLVGGVLRDRALGEKKVPHDIDLAVSGSAKNFAERISKHWKATLVVLHAQTRVYRVIREGSQVADGGRLR